MAARSAAGRGLNLSALRRVRALWREDVQRISLAELWSDSDHSEQGQLRRAQRTHREQKVRIAHRLQDFLFLPYKAMADPCIRCIYEKYVDAYNMHEDFGQLQNSADATEYWLGLAHVFEQNQNVTTLMGKGRQRLVRLDPGLAPTLDGFLGRFFVSRMGTHLLGANFLHQATLPPGAKKPAGVAMGVLQNTCPASFVHDLACSLASANAGPAVPVEIEGDTDTSILYIPGHLRGILREILQNSIRESSKIAEATGASEAAPVRVKINHGQFGVFVTVSDKAGGIEHMEHIWNWGEDPRMVQDAGEGEPDEDDDPSDLEDPSVIRPMRLPLGFGLPLARLTARYFGGDLRLQTLVGHGTNAYIHIPELQEEGNFNLDSAETP